MRQSTVNTKSNCPNYYIILNFISPIPRKGILAVVNCQLLIDSCEMEIDSAENLSWVLNFCFLT